MRYEFVCQDCEYVFDDYSTWKNDFKDCPKCGGVAKKRFNVSGFSFHIPLYWHVDKNEFFTYEERQAMKRNPEL